MCFLNEDHYSSINLCYASHYKRLSGNMAVSNYLPAYYNSRTHSKHLAWHLIPSIYTMESHVYNHIERSQRNGTGKEWGRAEANPFSAPSLTSNIKQTRVCNSCGLRWQNEPSNSVTGWKSDCPGAPFPTAQGGRRVRGWEGGRRGATSWGPAVVSRYSSTAIPAAAGISALRCAGGEDAAEFCINRVSGVHVCVCTSPRVKPFVIHRFSTLLPPLWEEENMGTLGAAPPPPLANTCLM